MAGTIFSNNTTIKISQAVSATTSTTGTLYTCAANSYAVLNLGCNSLAITYTVGGRSYTTNTNTQTTTIYVGPSQVVAVTFNGSGTVVSLTGVEFTNSP